MTELPAERADGELFCEELGHGHLIERRCSVGGFSVGNE